MSRLDKLVIHGCRSFGPDPKDQQSIKFFTPLTLILGQNGCGKTTIIESLKIAACGEFPPGSDRGKLFIHDPKISKATETRAQVRLRLFDANDLPVEVTRSFTVTQKPKTQLFKSNDATLKKTDKDGKSTTASLRCIDIDAHMCQVLQVSKAILNYVIFCHQEESSWPLDEGKKLKERFDLIFESSMYNKCIDTLIKNKKSLRIEADLFEKDLVMLAERKAELENKRSQKERLTQQVAEGKEQALALTDKMEPVTDRLAVLQAKEANIVTVSNEKCNKETKLTLLREQERELLPKIGVEYAGSVEQLRDEIDSFATKLAQKERSKKTLQNQLDGLMREEERIQKSVSQEQLKLGQLQKEEELNRANVEGRNRSINRLIQDLDIPATQQTQMTEVVIEGLVSQIEKKLGVKQSELEGIRAHLEFEEADMQARVDSLRDAKSRVEHELKSKQAELDRCRADTRDTRKELEEVNLSAGKLELLAARLARATRDLEDVTRSVDVPALKAAIDTHLEEEKSLDLRAELVNKEVSVLTARSSTQAELDVGRKTLLEKEAAARKIRNQHDDNLRVLFKDVPEANFKHELQSRQDKLARDIREMNSRVNAKQSEQTTLEANLAHQRTQLRHKEEDLRQSEDKMIDHCGSRSYDDTLHHVSESITVLQDKTGTMDASVVIYKRYVAKLAAVDPSCPLCHRGFDGPDEASELARGIRDKIHEVPIKLQEARKELLAMNRKYDALQQLKPVHTKISQLKDIEIPNLRKEVSTTQEKLSASRAELEDLSASLAMPQTEEAMARAMSGDMVLLDQHLTEVRRLKRDIETLEAKMPHGGLGRSMQQALAEQEQLRTDALAARRNLQAAQSKMAAHNDSLTRLREQKNELVAEQLEIRGGLARRQELQNKLSELQAGTTALGEAIEALANQLAPARSELETAERERDDAKKKNRRTVEEMRANLATEQRKLDDVKSLQRCVEDFERRGIRGKLATAQSSLATLEAEIGTVRRDKDEASSKVNSLNRDISTQQVRERELEDNLRLRNMRQDASTLAEEVRRLVAKIGDLDYRALTNERTRLNNQLAALQRDRNQLEGRQVALEDSIASLNRELAKDMYVSAERKYMEKYAELMMERTAVDDLSKFVKAMEAAMITFHEVRMRQTNAIIRELWRQVYRGNDIDYIEIKTDVPESAMEKRRQYNYRVVQMKGTTELDMRGRCSAGQKVLACLVIRIALAETFSARCGIFTLDEPTTNLDEQNVKSLSLALNALVNARSIQKNFQLVIITHDEEFLESLTEGERVTTYYKVSRNQNGKSVIEKRRVADA